jgi:hypothetical protein
MTEGARPGNPGGNPLPITTTPDKALLLFPPIEVSTMRQHAFFLPFVMLVLLLTVLPVDSQEKEEKLYLDPIDVKVPPIASDKSVKYDYDIVYIRAPRAGDTVQKRFFTDFSTPITLEPGADLMLLHPDGKEELLIKGGEGSVTDPVVSLDGQSVYYTLLHNLKDYRGSEPSQPRCSSQLSTSARLALIGRCASVPALVRRGLYES